MLVEDDFVSYSTGVLYSEMSIFQTTRRPFFTREVIDGFV